MTWTLSGPSWSILDKLKASIRYLQWEHDQLHPSRIILTRETRENLRGMPAGAFLDQDEEVEVLESRSSCKVAPLKIIGQVTISPHHIRFM